MSESGLKVVPLNDDRPSLRDITGRLRWYADQLDRFGEPQNNIATSLIVTLLDTGEVQVICLGDNPPRHAVAGLLFTAATQRANQE